MKRKIRRNVFETNSSSTHSISICSEEEYSKWKNGELLYDDWEESFVEPYKLTDSDMEDAIKEYEKKKGTYWKEWNDLTEEETEKWISDYVSMHISKEELGTTYDDYFNCSYLDTYEKYYTTKNGDEVVAFGRYGYDG